jgi:hypothetical protein
MRPGIHMDGDFDYYSIAHYNVVSNTADLYDQYVTFRAGMTYLPTRNFFIGPRYKDIYRGHLPRLEPGELWTRPGSDHATCAHGFDRLGLAGPWAEG